MPIPADPKTVLLYALVGALIAFSVVVKLDNLITKFRLRRKKPTWKPGQVHITEADLKRSRQACKQACLDFQRALEASRIHPQQA